MTILREALPLWANDAPEINRRWEDADPARHDIPDPCICAHDRNDDHTRVDGGCSVPGCPCPWFDPNDYQPLDEYEPEHYWTGATEMESC